MVKESSPSSFCVACCLLFSKKAYLMRRWHQVYTDVAEKANAGSTEGAQNWSSFSQLAVSLLIQNRAAIPRPLLYLSHFHSLGLVSGPESSLVWGVLICPTPWWACHVALSSSMRPVWEFVSWHPQAFLPVSCLEGGPHSTDSSYLDVVSNEWPDRDALARGVMLPHLVGWPWHMISLITLWSDRYVHMPMTPNETHQLMVMFLLDPRLIAFSELEHY